MAFIVAINACGPQAKMPDSTNGIGDLPPIDDEENVSIIVGRDSVYYVKEDPHGVAHHHDHDTISNEAAQIDTTAVKEEIFDVDTLPRRGALEFPVRSSAKDSIIEDFSNGKKILHYYGDVNVKYGDDLEIKSAYMRYDMDTKVVYASGLPDSSGTVQGKPEMQDGSQNKYVMEEVYHNFETQKSVIKHIIMQESDGFLHGDMIKKMPDNSTNIKKGMYTTCDHEHPHFYLRLTRAKMTENKAIIFGPAYLVLEDVPMLPFVLPFGFVPKNTKRSGGLLIPSFNEETTRGFSLKGLGYYFVFSDHFDATLTGDFFTMGSWNARLTSRYRKRYKYNGDLNVNYSITKLGDKGDHNYSETTNFGFQWSHAQDVKARPGTTFRASVNFSSPGNNRYNSESVQNILENQIGSSISYSKIFPDSPFSVSFNMTHNQNSRDSSYAITFPNITFTMNRINPFKKKYGVGKPKFYEDITLSYNTKFDNKVNFKASEFGDDDFMSKFRSSMNHSFGIGLPGFTLLKYLQFSPNISYGMNWYFQQNDKYYDDITERIEDDITALFSHFGATHTFSASLSASTTIYGMYNFHNSRISAVRHMVKPNISLSVTPNMTRPWNGFRTMKYIDKDGEEKPHDFNIYDRLGGPSASRGGASMSFGLTNNLEAKVKSRKDTTETKVKLIDNLSLTSGYDFLADSLKLRPILATLSTTVFGSLALNVNASMDPYAVDSRGGRISMFHIAQKGGFRPVRITNASASFSYQFSGKGGNGRGQNSEGGNAGNMGSNQAAGQSGGIQHKTSPYMRVYENPLTGEYIPGGWVYYLDPENPWSVSFNYSYSYGRSGGNNDVKHTHTQTLGLSAQLRLGPSMNFNLQSGLDISKMRLTTTQLSATYDLHDFLISVSWVPMGLYQSWGFRINAKASALADLLKFRKNASPWDNGSFIQR